MQGNDSRYIVDYSKQLLNECLDLKAKITDYDKEKKIKFNDWKSKRERLEAIEGKYDQMNEAEKNWLTNRYIEPIRKIIYQEILKLLPPRKRKYARELLNSSHSSHNLSWENLNLVPSSKSLSSGNETHCAACAKPVNWWSFFGKKKDGDGNLFCSQKCLNEFYSLVCDNCKMRIQGNFYYIDEERQVGTLCFLCGTVKCLGCFKTMPSPKNYFSGFLPIGNNGEVKKLSSNQQHNDQEKHNYMESRFCKSCREKNK